MLSNKLIFSLLSLLLLFNACKKDDDSTGGSELDSQLEEALQTASNGAGTTFFTMPESNDLSAIPQDPKNPLTEKKVALGKLLYHESGLALAPKQDINKGTYSCATCHFASAGFQAGRHQGISDGGIGFGINGEGRDAMGIYDPDSLDVQPIRTPTAMNGAYQELMLWNGQFGGTGMNIGTEASWTPGTPIETNNLGYQGLEIQAIAGLKVHRLVVDETILADLGYKPLFDDVFPNIAPSERYSREYAGLAIAAYERTLLANQAPFQQWLKGTRNAMTDQEKRGALVFFKDAQCATCHTGPALNAMEFHAIGMHDIFGCPEPTFQATADSKENLGRGGFTGRMEDRYKFKVPQLYNLSDSPFFGHGSSIRTIKEIVEYKNKAEAENPAVPAEQLADEFVPLSLSEEQIDDLTAFLAQALRDESLARYQPEAVLSGNCIPNNDPTSQTDLGCN